MLFVSALHILIEFAFDFSEVFIRGNSLKSLSYQTNVLEWFQRDLNDAASSDEAFFCSNLRRLTIAVGAENFWFPIQSKCSINRRFRERHERSENEFGNELKTVFCGTMDGCGLRRSGGCFDCFARLISNLISNYHKLARIINFEYCSLV